MLRVTVTKLRLGDCEDPEIYMAVPALKWLNDTEQGQWLKQQDLNCLYTIGHEPEYLGHVVTLHADMTDEQRAEWVLRWA